MRYLWLISVVTGTLRNGPGGYAAAFVLTAPTATSLSSNRLPRTPSESGQRRRVHPLSASLEPTAPAHASLGIGASSSSASGSAGRYGLAALSTRAQRLRELLLNKEILNDLTEAEFALTLAQSFEAAGNLEDDEKDDAAAENKGLLGGMSSAFGASARTAERRGASSIDFETLLSKLARHDASLEERLASLPTREMGTKADAMSEGVAGGGGSGPSSRGTPTVFAGLSATQLATLAARVRNLATDLSAVMERRDRARQAAAARKAAAAAAATAAAQEANAAERTEDSKTDSSSSSSSKSAGLDFLKRNKKLGALFPSSVRQGTKDEDASEEVDPSIVEQPSSKEGKGATSGSSTPSTSRADNNKEDADSAAAVSSSSSSVEELVESMVANPSGASKTMKQQFAVFVREDGTVDFDKAVETGKEVARYSAELWARLSGEPPKGDSSASSSSADGTDGGSSSSGGGFTDENGEKRPLRFDEILRLVDSSEPVLAAANRFASAQQMLRDTSERLRPRVEVAPPSNNGFAAAFTTAVVTRGATASSAPTAATAAAEAPRPSSSGDVFQQKRALAVAERAATRRARLAALDLDMERSCGVLATEIDQSAAEAWTETWRSDQRRLVAEFGLLDAQLAVLLGVLQAAEEEAAAAAAVEVTAPAAASASGTPSAVSFEAMDVNGDGAVSRDEFEAWKQQQQQQGTEGTVKGLVSTSASNGAAAASASTKASGFPVTGPTMDALVLSRIDADELEVVTRQVVDLVQRLGVKPVDPYSTGPVLSTSLGRGAGASLGGAFDASTEAASGFGFGFGASADGGSGNSGGFLGLPSPILSWGRVPRNLGEGWSKFVGGVDFYATGTKLLGDDINYASALLLKAAGGTTLSQREARTLRRTAKDLVTAVPVVIILIIPLSPVGHVLVFSFIQRIFPDFFPSPFTERRQNLMKLYDAIAPPPEDSRKLRKKN